LEINFFLFDEIIENLPFRLFLLYNVIAVPFSIINFQFFLLNWAGFFSDYDDVPYDTVQPCNLKKITKLINNVKISDTHPRDIIDVFKPMSM